jgi:endonuclease/exonuclease/phosphatase family metal-dependent hydrolase
MRLRVLTYNIHKCVGGIDRKLDCERVARSIEHYAPDIALLQEVMSADGKLSQADWLALRLGYWHRVYFPTVPRSEGRYGNAILSRFPISSFAHLDLTLPFKKRRSVIHARLRARLSGGRARTIHVYNLHLGLAGFERKIQLSRFLASRPFANLHHRAPVVVGGDFNDLWGTLGPKVLEPAGFRKEPAAPATFPAFAPLRALDSIYVRGDLGLERVWKGHTDACRRASDHLPLIADLSLERVSPLDD